MSARSTFAAALLLLTLAAPPGDAPGYGDHCGGDAPFVPRCSTGRHFAGSDYLEFSVYSQNCPLSDLEGECFVGEIVQEADYGTDVYRKVCALAHVWNEYHIECREEGAPHPGYFVHRCYTTWFTEGLEPHLGEQHGGAGPWGCHFTTSPF